MANNETPPSDTPQSWAAAPWFVIGGLVAVIGQILIIIGVKDALVTEVSAYSSGADPGSNLIRWGIFLLVAGTIGVVTAIGRVIWYADVRHARSE